MKLILVLATALLLSAPGSAVAGHRPHTRSPSLAFATAVFPGAAIHGLGNFYAGERKTAGILFTLEMFGVGLYLVDHQREDSMSGGGTALVGGALFVGSWIYDVMSAPEAAQRNNRRLRAQQPFSLQLEPLAPRVDDPLQPTFRFNRRF